MNQSLIRWYSIAQAAELTGLSEDFLREQIKLNKLRAKTFGNKNGMQKITDIELNRFSLDLQYPRNTAEKIKVKFTPDYSSNNDQNEFINNILKDLK